MDFRDVLDTTNLEELNYTIKGYNLSQAVWKNATMFTHEDVHIVQFNMAETNETDNTSAVPLEKGGAVALKVEIFYLNFH